MKIDGRVVQIADRFEANSSYTIQEFQNYVEEKFRRCQAMAERTQLFRLFGTINYENNSVSAFEGPLIARCNFEC